MLWFNSSELVVTLLGEYYDKTNNIIVWYAKSTSARPFNWNSSKYKH